MTISSTFPPQNTSIFPSGSSETGAFSPPPSHQADSHVGGFGKIKPGRLLPRYAPYGTSKKETFSKEEWDFIPSETRKKILKEKDTELRDLQKENEALKTKAERLQSQRANIPLDEDESSTSNDEESHFSHPSISLTSRSEMGITDSTSLYPSPLSKKSGGNESEQSDFCAESDVVAGSKDSLLPEAFWPESSLDILSSFNNPFALPGIDTTSLPQTQLPSASSQETETSKQFDDLQEKLQKIKRFERENARIRRANPEILAQRQAISYRAVVEENLFNYNGTHASRFYTEDGQCLYQSKVSLKIAKYFLENSPIQYRYGPIKRPKMFTVSKFTILDQNSRARFSIEFTPQNGSPPTSKLPLRNFYFPPTSVLLNNSFDYAFLQTLSRSSGSYFLLKDIGIKSSSSGGGRFQGTLVNVLQDPKTQEVTLNPTRMKLIFYPRTYSILGFFPLAKDNLLSFIETCLLDHSISVENFPTKPKLLTKTVSLINLSKLEPHIKTE